MSKLPADNAFHISFDTLDMPGKIKAVKVSLSVEVFDGVRDADKTFYINLCDHPLYPALVAYVAANKPRS